MTLPLLQAIAEAQRQDAPQPGEVVLKRQGVAEHAFARLPGLGYVEVHPDYRGFWLARIEERGEDGHCYAGEVVRGEDRAAVLAALADYLEQRTGERPQVSHAIEASCYHDAHDLKLCPCIEGDWYRVVFLYDDAHRVIRDLDGRVVCEFGEAGVRVVATRWEGLVTRAAREYEKRHSSIYHTVADSREWMAWLMSAWALSQSSPPAYEWRQSLAYFA